MSSTNLQKNLQNSENQIYDFRFAMQLTQYLKTDGLQLMRKQQRRDTKVCKWQTMQAAQPSEIRADRMRESRARQDTCGILLFRLRQSAFPAECVLCNPWTTQPTSTTFVKF